MKLLHIRIDRCFKPIKYRQKRYYTLIIEIKYILRKPFLQLWCQKFYRCLRFSKATKGTKNVIKSRKIFSRIKNSLAKANLIISFIK